MKKNTQEKITHEQYLAAVETVKAYRIQVTEHSKKVNADVTVLKINTKRIKEEFNYIGCSSETIIPQAPMSGRTYRGLCRKFKGREMYTIKLSELTTVSMQELTSMTNFGKSCEKELSELCKHEGIQMLP